MTAKTYLTIAEIAQEVRSQSLDKAIQHNDLLVEQLNDLASYLELLAGFDQKLLKDRHYESSVQAIWDTLAETIALYKSSFKRCSINGFKLRTRPKQTPEYDRYLSQVRALDHHTAASWTEAYANLSFAPDTVFDAIMGQFLIITMTAWVAGAAMASVSTVLMAAGLMTALMLSADLLILTAKLIEQHNAQQPTLRPWNPLVKVAEQIQADIETSAPNIAKARQQSEALLKARDNCQAVADALRENKVEPVIAKQQAAVLDKVVDILDNQANLEAKRSDLRTLAKTEGAKLSNFGVFSKAETARGKINEAYAACQPK